MKANVLVTAAGSIVAQGIVKSLRLASGPDRSSYSIVCADASPMAAGLYRSDRGIIVPNSSSPDYVDAMISACHKMEIDAIFCGSDDELLRLANASKQIEHETGAKLMVGTAQALEVARDKWKTFEFCTINGLPCAPSCLPENADDFILEHGFPVVVKPREGYGSVHMYVAADQSEMDHALSSITKARWHPIVQKFIAGDQEFTSGITIDKDARYVMSSISMRKIIKHGQTYKAFIDDFHDVRKSAEEVGLKLGTPGAINVQSKVDPDDGEAKVFEINPRFSATCPMRAAAGINEPDIVFRNSVYGEEIKAPPYARLYCARYLNEVYVPLGIYEKIAADPKATIKDTGSFCLDYF
jgi:carbamoyl-phosphate synthase large subunit